MSKKQEILVNPTKWETDPRVTSSMAGKGVDPDGNDDESSPRDTGRVLGSKLGEYFDSTRPFEQAPYKIIEGGPSGQYLYGPGSGDFRKPDNERKGRHEWGEYKEALENHDATGRERMAENHPEDQTNSAQLQQGWGGRHRRKRRTKKVKRGGKRKSRKSRKSGRRSKRCSKK